MMVKSYLDKSKIHGLGVFAGEKIPKGTLIWRFDPLIDKIVKKDDLQKLPELNRKFVIHYSYLADTDYVLGGDNGMYMNHVSSPNTRGEYSADGYGITLAARDIEEGEEITTDYSEFDDKFVTDSLK